MFKSKSFVWFASLVTLALTMSATAAFAAGGDGGPFNGPNLGGTSIPVELERGISEAEIKEVVRTCFAVGDETRGLVSLIGRVYEQAFGRPITKYDELLLGAFVISYSDSSVMAPDTSVNLNTGYLIKFKYWPNEEFKVCVGSNWGCSGDMDYDAVTVGTPGKLPYIQFSSVDQEHSFDDWGRPIEGARILSGIKIALPSKFGTAVPTINTDTRRNTNLKLNLVEYAECLSSEIQRRAVK